MMDQDAVIRSFEQANYTPAGLDREILRTIREVMIKHDLWYHHYEGTYEEIVKPTGALYIHDVETLDDDDTAEEVNDFMRSLLEITYNELDVTFWEDGEHGMSYLYEYSPDAECNCTDPYCGV